MDYYCRKSWKHERLRKELREMEKENDGHIVRQPNGAEVRLFSLSFTQFLPYLLPKDTK